VKASVLQDIRDSESKTILCLQEERENRKLNMSIQDEDLDRSRRLKKERNQDTRWQKEVQFQEREKIFRRRLRQKALTGRRRTSLDIKEEMTQHADTNKITSDQIRFKIEHLKEQTDKIVRSNETRTKNQKTFTDDRS